MSEPSTQQVNPEQNLESYTWDSSSGGFSRAELPANTISVEEPSQIVQEAAPVVDTAPAATTEEAQPAVQEVISETVQEPTQAVTPEVVTEDTEASPELQNIPETQEETVPETQDFIDDFYQVEASRMLEANELPEEFDLTGATPEAIREAWRNHNLGTIAENAQQLGLQRAQKMLENNYGAEVLEISRRISNGINEDTMDNLMAYKEAAAIDIDDLNEEEQNDYIRDYLVDKGLEDNIVNLTLKAAETEDAQRGLAEKAKEYFEQSFNSLNKSTKDNADAVERQRQQIAIDNQNFVQNVFQSGQINNEQMTTEQLLQLQQGLVEKTVPVKDNAGNTVNISQYDAFEQQVLNNYPLRVYLFKTLLHKGQQDSAAQAQIKAKVQEDMEKKWGRRVIKKGDSPPSAKSATTKKVNQETQRLESYTYKDGQFQAQS